MGDQDTYGEPGRSNPPGYCAGSESKDGRKETGEGTDHRTWNGDSGTGNRGWNCSEYSKSRMGIQRSDT